MTCKLNEVIPASSPNPQPAGECRAYIDARRGDLLTACEQHESLRAEICLAWLREQIERQPECAAKRLANEWSE